MNINNRLFEQTQLHAEFLNDEAALITKNFLSVGRLSKKLYIK